MQITCGSLLAGARAARGLAVIIDVFRAFSCTPLLYSLGIDKCILVSTPEEGFALKKKHKDFILLGEVSGVPIEGFDFGNSPSEILKKGPSFFKGKTAVQRTSSGVQGVLAALDGADQVLLCSFSIAKVTAHYILAERPTRVSLVAMGWDLRERAPEDEWCARYVSHLLGAGDYDHNEALREIISHKTTQRFLHSKATYFPPEDPVLCMQRDIYDFVLTAERKEDLVVVRKIHS